MRRKEEASATLAASDRRGAVPAKQMRKWGRGMPGHMLAQRLALLAVGAVCGLYVFARLDAAVYTALPLLPMGCGLLYFLFPSVIAGLARRPGLCCLHGVVLLRYLAAPVVLAAQDFPSYGPVPGSGEATAAVWLMLYELAAVFAAVAAYGRRGCGQGPPCAGEGRAPLQSGSLVAGGVIAAACAAAAVFPQLGQKYAFVLAPGELRRTSLGIPGVVELLFEFGCIFALLKSVGWISRRFPGRSGFWLAALLILLKGCFIPYTSRFGMALPLAAGWMVLPRCFPGCARLARFFFPLAFGGLLLVATLKKDGGLSGLSGTPEAAQSLLRGLSSQLQGYFAGVQNVATAVAMRLRFLGDLRPEALASDLCRSVMGLSRFASGRAGTTEWFNLVFYSGGGARDQIVPMVGQGYGYFGFVLSPLFSVFAALLTVEFDARHHRARDLPRLYLYGYFALRCGLFMMVNATILAAEFTNLLLPLALLIRLNEKVTLFPKGGGG